MSAIMVAGSWDETNPALQQDAITLGKTLALREHTVITGGGEGIPFYVNVGVHSVRGNNIAFINEGRMADRQADHYKVVKNNITTEMGWDGRSVLAVKACDYLIVLGGSNGTLNEMTLAYLHGIPIYVLADSSELITRFQKFLYKGKYIDVRENVEIMFFKTIQDILSLDCFR